MSDTATVTRRERWLELGEGFLLEKESTARGVALRYRADPGAAAELQDLVALERECCAFASWTVREPSGTDVLELRVEADGEGSVAIRRMFEEA